MTFDAPFFQILITAVFVAASAGLLGSFVILKRMALVGLSRTRWITSSLLLSPWLQ